MTRALAIAILAAGCYAPSAVPGAPCDPAAPRCPDGQQCLPAGAGHACGDGGGGPLDASPGLGDRDRDGIPDELDNCPDAANADQHDEDVDLRGDACDRCPPLPSLDDRDADQDGVGDACDPNPEAGGDRIVLFESFAAGIPASWIRTGTWIAIAGAAVHMAQGATLATVVVPLDGGPRQTISTAVTVLGLSGTGGGSLGIVDRFTPAADAGIHCGSGKAGATFFGLIDASNGLVLRSFSFPFDVGAYGIALRSDGERFTCTALELTSKTSVEDAPLLPGLGTRIGLRARTASAAYAWLMVVSSP